MPSTCRIAADALRPKISEVEYRDVIDYIEANEGGLSVETLIDYLGERDTTITPAEFKLISDAMTMMGLQDSGRMEVARELVKPRKNNFPTT